MNLEELLIHMQGLGLGTPGQNLFRHQMPEQIQEGLLVTSQVPADIHPYVIQYRKGSIQVIARSPNGDAAITKLNGVVDAISGEGLDLPSARVLRLYPRHEPLLYPKSEGALYEASVNFDIVFTLK